ncbi:vasodilator-stimulated phosphoprotein [Anaeramoeba flamelloides]|uniref:Vasodilator-stimulated phosphoprotein n=1 Tax=Anaeramoeba flamelloides TaxID=1746091 RepID=A0ABQ8XSG4_9EUKA|nr:vasodilator-stimulated phosphoprotein [Anaeramoeba flamelloides]
MSEKPIHSTKANQFYFDVKTKGWKPLSGGEAPIHIYHHSGKGTYRVIGMRKDKKVCINSNIFATMSPKKNGEKLVAWSNEKRVTYGVNFTTSKEADKFLAQLQKAIKALNSSSKDSKKKEKKSKKDKKKSKKEKRSSKKDKKKSKKKDSTPPPPKGNTPPPPKGNTPPPPSGGPPPPKLGGPPQLGGGPPPKQGGKARNALLDSIQGFSKNGLKKAETNDRSGPNVSNKPKSGGGGGGGGGGGLMDAILSRGRGLKKTGGFGGRPRGGLPKIPQKREEPKQAEKDPWKENNKRPSRGFGGSSPKTGGFGGQRRGGFGGVKKTGGFGGNSPKRGGFGSPRQSNTQKSGGGEVSGDVIKMIDQVQSQMIDYINKEFEKLKSQLKN